MGEPVRMGSGGGGLFFAVKFPGRTKTGGAEKKTNGIFSRRGDGGVARQNGKAPPKRPRKPGEDNGPRLCEGSGGKSRPRGAGRRQPSSEKADVDLNRGGQKHQEFRDPEKGPEGELTTPHFRSYPRGWDLTLQNGRGRGKNGRQPRSASRMQKPAVKDCPDV